MHLMKGNWEVLLAAEKYADEFRAAAAPDTSEAIVPLPFAIEARLRILAIVARDTVRPLSTYGEDGNNQEEAND